MTLFCRVRINKKFWGLPFALEFDGSRLDDDKKFVEITFRCLCFQVMVEYFNFKLPTAKEGEGNGKIHS